MMEQKRSLPRYAKRAIAFMLLGLALPFATYQNWYPFYRFGMFAEPAHNSLPREQFLLYKQIGGEWVQFDGSELGFNEGNFQVLMRNYYYRGQKASFIQRLQLAQPGTHWKLERLAVGE